MGIIVHEHLEDPSLVFGRRQDMATYSAEAYIAVHSSGSA